MDERWTPRVLLSIPANLLPLTPSGPVPISISPDAGHAAAFAALRPHGGPSVLVRDQPRGAATVQGLLSRPAWTFDGGRFACVLQSDDGRQRVVVDEAPSPTFAEILSPVWFSPAGSSFSYAARERDRCFVLVDHSPIREAAYAPGAMKDALRPRWESPPVDPAAAARAAAAPVLERLNGGDPMEIPAGAARLEFDMRGTPLSLRVGAKSVDLQRPPAAALEGFAWDAAGRWGALLRRAGRGLSLVIDGQERDTRGLTPFLFAAADGSALIYAERRPAGLFVVVGANEAGPFQWIGDVEGSPDGRALAFPALQGRDVRRVVLPAAA